MAQLMIRPRNDSVAERGLYSKIEKLLSRSEGKSDATIKSTFLDTIWPELEPDYRLMVGNLIVHCEHEIQQRGISAKVDGRVKLSSSINETLHRREEHRISDGLGTYERLEDMFRDMHDLAGLRIIVDYPSQLEHANQLVLECFQQESKPNIFTRDWPIGRWWDAWFGAYESCNHHVTLDTRATGILQIYRHVVFEIQVTSLAECLYNKLAHPLLYKQKSGKMSRQDEIVIDLSHGLALCHSLCLLYMEDKLDQHDKQPDQQERRNAMRNAVSRPDTQGEGDKDENQLTDGMDPLVGMIPDMVRRQIPNLSSKSNGKKGSTELFTGILSNLPEACDSPESIWPTIITQLSNWDARIGAVEAAMEKQTKAIEKAQNTSQAEADKKCLTDLRVINPSDHKKVIQKAKGGLLKDAYHWVLRNKDYLRFRNNSDHRLLWIKGDPGKGKTMLLCGIIDELLNEDRENISFFFCEATQSDQKRNATAVLRSLIWLLCMDQPHLVSYIRERYDSEGKDLFEDETTAFPALEEILIDMLHDSNCRDSIFIIDALDESSDDTRSDIINLIIQLPDSIQNAKWIVSSRNWSTIEEQFHFVDKVEVSLELNPDSISRAVDIFINHKVLQLARLKRYSEDTKEAVLGELHRKADETFLWVALVCVELSKPDVKSWNTIEQLNSMPRGLEKLYGRMLQQILSSRNSTLCGHILASSTIGFRPLLTSELLFVADGLEVFRPEQIVEIVAECGSFLCIRDSTVYFVHQSAQEFLLEPENYYKLSHLNKEEYHLNMFRQSLKALKNLYRNMYNIPSPGGIIDAPDPDPLACLGYVSLFWARHLIAGGGLVRGGADQYLLEAFLKNKLLNWLEALSLKQQIPDGVATCRSLLRTLPDSTDKSLKSLIKDACRFVLTFRHAFELAPLQVYVSALIFSPTSSVVKRLYQADQPTWINLRSEPPSNWDTCTQTIEAKNTSFDAIALAPDGRTLASSSARQLQLWDTEKGCCTYSCETNIAYISRLAFSPNGKQLAALYQTSGFTDRVVLFDLFPSVNSDRLFLGLDNNKGFEDFEEFNAKSIVFSPSGLHLAASSTNASAKIWDLSTRCCVRTMTRPSFPDDYRSCIAYSEDGMILATGTVRDGVRIWAVETGQCIHVINAPCWRLAFLPQILLVEEYMAWGFSLWNMETWVNTPIFGGFSAGTHALIPLNLPGLLFASTSGASIRLWGRDGGFVRRLKLKGHGAEIIDLAFSAHNGLLISSALDRTLKLWDLAAIIDGDDETSSQEYRNDKKVDRGYFYEMSDGFKETSEPFIQGEYRSSSNDEGTLTSTRSDSYTMPPYLGQNFEHDTSSIQMIALSPDFRWLVSLAADCIKIWDVAGCACVQTIIMNGPQTKGPAPPLLEFSSDGCWLFCASDIYNPKSPFKIWETATWTSVQQSFSRHGGDAGAVGLSPDGKLMARSIRGYGSTYVILLETGEHLHDLPRSAKMLAFSPDSRVLVLCSELGVQAYDTKVGSELWRLDVKDLIEVFPREETDNKMGSDVGSETGGEIEDGETYFTTTIQALALSSDATRLAIATAWRSAVWNVEDPQPGIVWVDRLFSLGSQVAINTRWFVMATNNDRLYVKDLTNEEPALTIPMQMRISGLDFDSDNENRLLTNAGTWSIQDDGSIHLEGFGLSNDGSWVSRNNERLLWLPSEYRGPAVAQFKGTKVALGSPLGHVALLEFGNVL